jgi:sugar lactone lactonase YvrE
MREKKGIRTVVAGLLCSMVLAALMPLTASGVEYMSLATVGSQLKYPADVAASASGSIYAVDTVRRKLVIYSASYQVSANLYSVSHPTSIAVSGETLFVADSSTKSVKILNSAGAITGELKKDGVMAQFRLARNIAVDAAGSVYVVDQFADKIVVFDAAGNYSYTIPGLNMPQDAVVVGNELFIIDQPAQSTDTSGGDGLPSSMHLAQVRIYDLATQAFVEDETRAFPVNGTDTASGQYMSLKGIAADPQGYLYLTDAYLHIIYKYDTNGQFLGAFEEPVNTPLGATVSPDGRLVVCSSHDETLRVYGVDYEAGLATWLNDAPIADAGADQVVSEEASFVLDGSGSFDEDGIIGYSWTQTMGTPVLPESPYYTETPLVTLTAPATDSAGTLLVFRLVVTDGLNKTGGSDATSVTVNNVISGSVVINDADLYTNDPLVTLTFDAPEAVEMRLANDAEPFSSAYQPFSATTAWTLSAYDSSAEANTKTVRVEFRDAGGNTTVASSTILLDMQAPVAPGIGSITTPGDFDWAPVEGAVSYTLEYAFNSDFSDAVTLTGLTYNGATIALDGLAYGTWFWRVAATDAAGNAGEWSTVGTFVLEPPNLPPAADAGPSQTVSENSSFTLDASASSDDKGIMSYTWTQTGGTPVLVENPLTTENATLALTAPAVDPMGGTLTFELTVVDAEGETGTAATEVTVHNVISGTLVINSGDRVTNNRSAALTLAASEAVEMRFANDAEPFPAEYMAYSDTATWTLGPYNASIPENTKTVRVEFRDAGGNTAVASDTIRLDMNPPDAPVLETSDVVGLFDWRPVFVAASFTLQYSFSSDFSEATTATNIRRTYYTVAFDGIENFGTCYWRVKTVDSAGNVSEWSEIGTFEVLPGCSVATPALPEIVWPADGAADISRTVLLETGDIDYPAFCGYHASTAWQVSETADFSSPVLSVETSNYPTMYQVPHLMLDPGVTYYWRAKHVADTGMESSWSQARAFTTAAGDDIAGVEGIIYDESIEIKKGIITLRQPVGDSDIKLNQINVADGTVPLLIKELDPATIADTENRPPSFPYGLLSFRIAVEPGTVAQLELEFSEEAPEGGIYTGYVYAHEEGWHINPNIFYQEQFRSLTFELQDGGIGDADGVVNGIIVSP